MGHFFTRIRIDDMSELESGLEKAMAMTDKLVFVAIAVDQSEEVYPMQQKFGAIDDYPDGSGVSNVYSVVGGKVKMTTTRRIFSHDRTALASQVKETVFNTMSEVESRTDAKGSSDEVTTRFSYYGNGLPQTISVDNKPAISFEFDNAGNRTRLNDPNIGSLVTLYNAMNKARQTTPVRSPASVTTNSTERLKRYSTAAPTSGTCRLAKTARRWAI